MISSSLLPCDMVPPLWDDLDALTVVDKRRTHRNNVVANTQTFFDDDPVSECISELHCVQPRPSSAVTVFDGVHGVTLAILRSDDRAQGNADLFLSRRGGGANHHRSNHSCLKQPVRIR